MYICVIYMHITWTKVINITFAMKNSIHNCHTNLSIFITNSKFKYKSYLWFDFIITDTISYLHE